MFFILFCYTLVPFSSRSHDPSPRQSNGKSYLCHTLSRLSDCSLFIHIAPLLVQDDTSSITAGADGVCVCVCVCACACVCEGGREGEAESVDYYISSTYEQ